MTKNIKEPAKRNDYKIILSELGTNPIKNIKIAFALMGVIPLLILFYLIIGKNFLYRLFLGNNGLIIVISVFISFIGYLLAYGLVANMVSRLLLYSAERKRSDEEKTELLLAVSHDLKTPLTVIRTSMQNLLDGIGGAINKTQMELARICLRAVDKTNSFVSELLEVSRIAFIRTNLRRELVDLKSLIENELCEISELAKKNGQALIFKAPASDANTWGDKEKLSRVVMNLLSNAIKYTQAGGRIEVTLSADRDTVKLAVINTGPGIPPDKIATIFDKYDRGKPGLKAEGTGLGLSIVKEIVDLHKGRISAESEPGEETAFIMVLPKDLRAGTRA